MIGNQQVARQISELMLEFGANLDESIALVMKSCPEDEFKRYRLAVGRVMGEMLLEIMNPLYAQHPDLKPAEFS